MIRRLGYVNVMDVKKNDETREQAFGNPHRGDSLRWESSVTGKAGQRNFD